MSERRLTRAEYEDLVARGVYGSDDRMELLDGRFVMREPQATPHATAIRLGVTALRAAFGMGFIIDVQLPVALDDDSEPEPDLAVVPGHPRDYRRAHPTHPVLIVEVAESSLAVDRTLKAALYARARISDYWIVNLVEHVVEVHRAPVPSPATPYGWRYASIVRAVLSDTITPLAAPHARIAVANLLP
jgi:Uma2 family endonuclease